jgi:hypothetical protein
VNPWIWSLLLTNVVIPALGALANLLVARAGHSDKIWAQRLSAIFPDVIKYMAARPIPPPLPPPSEVVTPREPMFPAEEPPTKPRPKSVAPPEKK